MPDTKVKVRIPSRKSRKFEDNATVISIFSPDEERQIKALKYLIGLLNKKPVA